MKKLLSASEIVALGLPSLPATKVGIRNMAERESWYFEEKKGLGGTRRLYEIPERYLSKTDATPATQDKSTPMSAVAGTIAAGGQANVELLELAMRTLSEWEAERGVKVNEERRPAVIAVMYDYLQKGESKEAFARLMRAVS